MTIIEDAYIIAVDQEYESTETAAGIVSLNAAYINPEEEDRHKYKRVYGKVLACPERFYEKVVNLIDVGTPAPHGYIGHDYIQAKSNAGMSLKSLPGYYPSTFDGYPVVTMADIAKRTDIKLGDRVYFDYLAINDDNFLGDHQGANMYRMEVDKIFVVVRDGEIIMQNGWTLVEPEMEDWEDIKTPSGIYKKPNPEAKHLLGVVCYMQHRSDLSIGDRIVYINDADAPLKVEGKDFYCMHQSEILCKMNQDELTWKDLQGKSFQECLDIRFNGWKPAWEKENCIWWLYSYITAGRDYGFQLRKKDDGYYLETYEESGYANGIVVAGPLDESQAERITECFKATNRNYNDDPS